jgi:hypothetical protein
VLRAAASIDTGYSEQIGGVVWTPLLRQSRYATARLCRQAN